MVCATHPFQFRRTAERSVYHPAKRVCPFLPWQSGAFRAVLIDMVGNGVLVMRMYPSTLWFRSFGEIVRETCPQCGPHCGGFSSLILSICYGRNSCCPDRNTFRIILMRFDILEPMLLPRHRFDPRLSTVLKDMLLIRHCCHHPLSGSSGGHNWQRLLPIWL